MSSAVVKAEQDQTRPFHLALIGALSLFCQISYESWFVDGMCCWSNDFAITHIQGNWRRIAASAGHGGGLPREDGDRGLETGPPRLGLPPPQQHRSPWRQSEWTSDRIRSSIICWTTKLSRIDDSSGPTCSWMSALGRIIWLQYKGSLHLGCNEKYVTDYGW